MSEPHTADLGTRYRYRREGAEMERERIIKLLEDFYDGNLWRQTGATSYVGFDIVELIELIKGEQK